MKSLSLKNKKAFLIAQVLFILSFQAIGQSTQQATEATVAAIRQTFKKINALPLIKQHFKVEESGCVEDGTVDFYLSGGTIVKIIESGAIGDGSWYNEYYFDGGKLIFVYEKLVGGPADGRVTTTEYRFYIKDGA